MSQVEPRGTSGSATPAEPSPTPVATPPAPAPSSLPTEAQQQFAKRVSEAKSPAEVRKIMAEATAQQRQAVPPPAPEDGTPAGSTPAAEPAAAAPAEPTPTPDPAAGEPPAADPAPEPAAGAPAEPEPAAEPGADPDADPNPDEVQPLTADRARLRLNADDEVGRMAAAFKVRNKDWTLKQCMEAAERKIAERTGVQPPAAAPDPAAPAPAPRPNADLPQTVAGVDSAIEQLEAEKQEAADLLDLKKITEIDGKIRKLDRHRTDLERQAERQQQSQAAEYDQRFSDSETRAAQFYPFAADPDSPLGKRMIEIEESLRELGDPIYNDPNKPMIIAQMVAKENNIAPRKQGSKAPAPATPPAPPRPATPPKGVLPAGGSRTAPAPAAPTVAPEIANIRTLGDLRKVMRGQGVRDF